MNSINKQTQEPLVTANVTAIDQVNEHIRIITLEPDQPVTWQAGQYAFLSFNNLDPRPYSIASTPDSGTLEIHVKRGYGDASNFIMDGLNQGDHATLHRIEGVSIFDLAKHMNEPIIAIAGGLGISPFKSIISAALDGGFAKDFHLFWGAEQAAHLYLDKHFLAVKEQHPHFSYTPITGQSVLDHIEQHFDDLSGHRIYVSGPPAMISAAVGLLLKKGAQRDKIRYDQHPEAKETKS